MNKEAKIKYFGVILPFIIFIIFALFGLLNISNNLFLLPAFLFGSLAVFMNWYRRAYLRNKFEPVLSKIEAIAILIVPLAYFWVYAFLGYVNPPFVSPLLIITVISFLVLVVHFADRKSKWDMQQRTLQSTHY